jgi:anthranilate phosphoribosyltransferase
LRALLDGKAHEGDSEVVSINAGALLMTAGVAKTIAEGTAIAAEKIGSGAAGRVLDAYIEASNG